MKEYVKKSQRFVALVLAVLVAFTMMPVSNVFAASKVSAQATKKITWSGGVKVTADGGAVTSTLKATLSGDTFAVKSKNLSTSAYTVTTKISGLTTTVAIDSTGKVATIKITGKASAAARVKDYTNYGLTFKDTAFTGKKASSVTNYSNKKVAITFVNVSKVAVTPTTVVAGKAATATITGINMSSTVTLGLYSSTGSKVTDATVKVGKVTTTSIPYTITTKSTLKAGTYTVKALKNGKDTGKKATLKVTAPVTYTVKYNANEGTGTVTDSTKYAKDASVKVKSGSSLTREGYTFEGWNTKADGSGTDRAVNASFKITGNVTLYAVWGSVGPTVTTVAVTPATVTIPATGGTEQFSATVTGTGSPAQTVTWSIVETTVNAGTTISATGLLTVNAADAGKTITVKATSTVDNKKSGTAVVTVSSVAAVTVSGVTVSTTTPGVGDVVTANVTMSDSAAADARVTYQWQVETAAASGTYANATGAGNATMSYTVATDDLGKKLQVVVTGVAPVTGAVTSTATAVVVAKTPITAVVISDTTPNTGDVLTAALTPADATATYSWKVGTEEKATTATYTVVNADQGKTITVTVTGTGLFAGTVTSAVTEAVPVEIIVANAAFVATDVTGKTYTVTGTNFTAANVETLKLWKGTTDATAMHGATFTITPASTTEAKMTLTNPLALGATDYKVGLTAAKGGAVTAPAAPVVTDIVAINPTTVKVTFATVITAASEVKENYTTTLGTVESAKKTADKEITLSLAHLKYGDTFTITVVDVNSVRTIKIPAITDLYDLKITNDATDNTIKSDGASMTMLTAQIWDKTSAKYLKEYAIIRYNTTIGALSQPQVAMQNGEASTQLTSIFSDTSVSTIVTATVDSAPGNQQFVGLTGNININFTPSGKGGSSVSYITAVSAGSSQGDRFSIQFSDPVVAANYKADLKKGVKYLPYGKETAVTMNIKDVYNITDKIVMFVLNTDTANSTMATSTASSKFYDATTTTRLDANPISLTPATNYLRDNVNHSIIIPDIIANKIAATSSTAPLTFMMTDVSMPSVYGVTGKDNMKLEVTLSESVAEDMVEQYDLVNTNLDMATATVGSGSEQVAVNKHFAIDGRYLMLSPKLVNPGKSGMTADILANYSKYAREHNYIMVDKLYVGSYTNDINDTRNKVYIDINKDFKLEAGAHGIEISNIGDWAGMVDKTQNMLTTQTFTFVVPGDTSAPTAKVERQSPEQWLITFNRAVETSAGKSVSQAIKIYKKSEFDKAADQQTALVQGTNTLNTGDYIMTVVDANGVKVEGTDILTPGASLAGVERILVEFNRDWSVALKGNTESADNYWKTTVAPLTFVFSSIETATGVALPPAAVTLPNPYDFKSPTIEKAEDLYSKITDEKLDSFRDLTNLPTNTGQLVYVRMSEPVQLLSKKDGTTANITIPVTASLEQDPLATPTTGYRDLTGVPIPTYRFMKGDSTVYGDVQDATLAADDITYVIKPRTPLTEGTWDLFIESISDDHGNTSATTGEKVVVPPSVTGGGDPTGTVRTAVAWAAFDNHSIADATAGKATYDYIYVKFTKEMLAQGSAKGVDSTKNYKFRGQELPIGTSISQGINGITSNKWDGVTIAMPKGSWDGLKNGTDFTTNMSVASNFVGKDGVVLTGDFQFELTNSAKGAAGDTSTGNTNSLADMDGVNGATASFANLEAYYSGTKVNSGLGSILGGSLGLSTSDYTVDEAVLTIKAGTKLTNFGDVIIPSGLTLVIPTGAEFKNAGTITVSKGATLDYFANTAGSTVSQTAAGKIIVASGATLKKKSVTMVSSTGPITVGANATMTITQPTTDNVNYAFDGGVVTLNGGTTGLVTSAKESMLVNSGATLKIEGTVAIGGTLTVAKGGKVTTTGATVVIADKGKFMYTESAFALATASALATSTVETGTLTGDIIVSATIAAPATVTQTPAAIGLLSKLTGATTTITYAGTMDAAQTWVGHALSSTAKTVTITSAGAATAVRS